MMAQPSKDKLWTSTFILLTVVQTMDLLTFHTITPVIAKFTIQQGAALAASGLAASVFSFASMFARPLSGLIADKLGRRPIILTAIAVSVAMQLGYALTPGFAPLLVLRIVHGFFYALFGTAISALALSTIPESRSNEGMGWFGASYVIAAIIGPAMGVAISDALGFTAMFLITAGIAAASFPLAIRATVHIRKDHVHDGEADASAAARDAAPSDGTAHDAAAANGTTGYAASPNEAACGAAPPDDTARNTTSPDDTALPHAAAPSTATPDDTALPHAAAPSTATPIVKDRDAPASPLRLPKLSSLISPRCIPLASIAICFMCSWGMIAGYIVLVGDARNVAGVPLFFMANSLALLVTRPAIGKISDKYGLAKLILPAIVIETIALLGICFARELWLFLAAGIFKAFGSGGVLPSIQAECGRLESKERSGVAMSTYLLGSDIGYAVGPLLGGLLASAVGYDLLLFGTLPITALAFAIYAIWHACTQK